MGDLGPSIPCPSGRLLLDGDRPICAEPAATSNWAKPPPGVRPPPDAAVRAQLADAWLRDALFEHAAVASFARATSELIAVGAPPPLIEDSQQAGLEEVEHAQLCFGLAQIYGSPKFGPGLLPAIAPRTADLVTVARSTFVEGCVSQTVAALVAQRSVRTCGDEAISEILETLADDEARHAALAWRIVGWAIRRGGPSVLGAVQRQAEQTKRRGPASGELPHRPEFGRMGTQARHEAWADAWRDIIEPMLASAAGTSRRRARRV